MIHLRREEPEHEHRSSRDRENHSQIGFQAPVCVPREKAEMSVSRRGATCIHIVVDVRMSGSPSLPRRRLSRSQVQPSARPIRVIAEWPASASSRHRHQVQVAQS